LRISHLAISMADVTNECNEFNDLDTKKALMTDKLQKREDDRLAHVQKRKEDKESKSAENESVTFFETRFSEARKEIEEGLEPDLGTAKEQLVQHFDGLSILHQKLQKFLSDSAMFLTSHDISRSQEEINQLLQKIKESREKCVPKKKFAFGKKTKKSEKASEKPTAEPKKVVSVAINECNFSDKSGETLIKTQNEIGNKDVALARLSDCVVKLYGSPSALHIDKLDRCTILCGPVSGSIFMDHCTDCTLVIACQQLRVHHTTRTQFYLHVTSRGIIEDCNSVQFAPYNLKYDDIDKHYLISGLDETKNTWDDIDDFNWLANDVHSPNWSLLPENERKSSWD